jgi:hypothetical protein
MGEDGMSKLRLSGETSYEFRKKVRALSPQDSKEVERFRDYLKDKGRLPADQFKLKWDRYERGLE